jgi:hypothetical protein
MLLHSTGVGGGSQSPLSRSLQVAPSPVTNVAHISYDVRTSGNVRLTLYDVTGRPVSTIRDGRVAAGRHAVELNVQGLEAGIYLLRLEAGAEQATKKLVVE